MARFAVAYGCALFAMLAGGLVRRTVPGGPFLSVLGDLVPIASGLVAVAAAWPVVRRGWKATFGALIPILVATLAIAFVVRDVYSFWTRPHARGELIRLLW